MYRCIFQSHSGVFGAGSSGEGDFSQYEGRDVELDPPPPVMAVITVAYIPPEDGRGVKRARPRVTCFLADGHAQTPPYASASFVDDWEGLQPVWMECVLSHLSSQCGVSDDDALGPPCSKSLRQPLSRARANHRARYGGEIIAGDEKQNSEGMEKSEKRHDFPCLPYNEDDVNDDDYGDDDIDDGDVEDDCYRGNGDQFPRNVGVSSDAASNSCRWERGRQGNETRENELRVLPHHSPRLSGGSARSRSRLDRVLPSMLPASSSMPLEDADTFLLVGTHMDLLDKTAKWLKHTLPNAVILGGLSNCALVVGDKVRVQLRRQMER